MRKIKLNSRQFKNLVTECVKRVIMEDKKAEMQSDWNDIDNLYKDPAYRHKGGNMRDESWMGKDPYRQKNGAVPDECLNRFDSGTGYGWNALGAMSNNKKQRKFYRNMGQTIKSMENAEKYLK